eukprot:6188992-Pleurochrysis_carterae.AAC.1
MVQEPSKQCLWVLTAEEVRVFSSCGEAHTISLPYKAASMWPMLRGVVIEADFSVESRLRPRHRLWWLLEPLSEALPVERPGREYEGGIILSAQETTLWLRARHNALAARTHATL